MAANMNKIRLGLIQLAVTTSKQENMLRVNKSVAEAALNKANVIALPECFNSPYGNQYFPQYAETIPGDTTNQLAGLAKHHNVYIIGGSIPEIENGKFYNTCTVFGPNGVLLAKHRKVHLFDIDIPGKITFKESDTLTPGEKITAFHTPQCKIGLGICFDMRFAEMAQTYARNGCKLLIYPGAFNMTTGPAHWELLQRARAVDNQIYVATISPARDERASYIAWGHSMVVNPWGTVIGQLDHKEGILYTDIDLDFVDEIRGQIPVFSRAGTKYKLMESPPIEKLKIRT